MLETAGICTRMLIIELFVKGYNKFYVYRKQVTTKQNKSSNLRYEESASVSPVDLLSRGDSLACHHL